VTGTPSLYPAFDPAVPDYVSRCAGQGGQKLSIAAPPGESVSVDGGPPRTGSYQAQVPLKPGQATVLVAHSAQGSASYHVRCLPRDFPRWSAEPTGPTQAQWYLLSAESHWATFFDARGVPVWWRATAGKADVFNPTLFSNGHVAWYPQPPEAKFGIWPGVKVEEHRLDGSLVRRLSTVGVPTDLHEIQRLPNGDYLLDAYRPREGVDLSAYGGPKKAKVYYAEVQEIAPGGGLVWRWNARGHIGLGDTKRWWPYLMKVERNFPARDRSYDAQHINSIAPDGDGLVISCRHTDAVYRIDRKSGAVDWKLGGTHTKKSLTIVGDPRYGSTSFGGQHDARVLPDGTLTVYDNGSRRERPPRVLRFRIDRGNRTATLIEDLTDPDAPRSDWQGGTRKLPGGDWVTSWSSTSQVTEMTPAGKRVLRLQFPGRVAYRAVPVPFGVLTAARLRAAMDRLHPRS
jgi:hypothetical protein